MQKGAGYGRWFHSRNIKICEQKSYVERKESLTLDDVLKNLVLRIQLYGDKDVS
jgi:hypothetical protein